MLLISCHFALFLFACLSVIILSLRSSPPALSRLERCHRHLSPLPRPGLRLASSRLGCCRRRLWLPVLPSPPPKSPSCPSRSMRLQRGRKVRQSWRARARPPSLQQSKRSEYKYGVIARTIKYAVFPVSTWPQIRKLEVGGRCSPHFQ